MKVGQLKPEEYHPYYETYISKVNKDATLLDLLSQGKSNFVDFIAAVPEHKLHYAYQNGKWTTAMLFQHIFDTERVFQYRALRFSRNDKTPLAGFDQEDFAKNYKVSIRNKGDLIKEFEAIREATLSLFKNMNEEVLHRGGFASDAFMSVRALGFVIVGHLEHHKTIILERYLN